MKKSRVIWVMMVLLICVAVATAACGGGAETPAPAPEAAAPEATAPEAPIEEKGTVTLLSWGGTVETTFLDEGMAEQFYLDTGYKFNLISKGDSAAIIATALAQKDNPEVDVVFCDMTAFTAGLHEDIFAPIADFDMPNVDDVYDNMVFDKYCYQYVDYIGLLYDKEVFDENGWEYPTGYEDLYRPELIGKITIDQFPSAFTDALIMAWADNDIENYGQAFEKLNQLAPYLYNCSETESQLAQWFSAKNIVMGVYAFGSCLYFPDVYGLTNLEFCFPEEGVYLSPAAIGIMKNTKNPEGAAALMNWMLSKEFQEYRLNVHAFLPVNKNIEYDIPVLTEEIQANALNLDVDALAEYREEWIELWTENVLNVPYAY